MDVVKPAKSEPCARLGWISPDGDFYPCGYCCHSALETVLKDSGLVRGFVRVEDDDGYFYTMVDEAVYPAGSSGVHNYTSLTALGWVQVNPEFYAYNYKAFLTEPQKDTLREIYFKMVEEGKLSLMEWRGKFLHNPEGYDAQYWMTPFPMRDPVQEYKEQLERDGVLESPQS